MSSEQTRISRDEMFMQMAEIASQRSTCSRLQVGCIITTMDGTAIVGIGYNGNARGLANACDTDIPGECGCIHAEVNALIKAPYHEGNLTLYTTISPCGDCAKLILNSRVTRVVYRHLYRNPSGLNLLLERGVEVDQLDDEQLGMGVVMFAAAFHQPGVMSMPLPNGVTNCISDR